MIQFYRIIICFKKSIPNAILYGGLDRYPAKIWINCLAKLVKCRLIDQFKQKWYDSVFDISKAVPLLWIVLLGMLHFGVCCAVVSIPCSLVVTCWERADLLAVMLCHFPKCVLVYIRIKGEVGSMKLV